MIEVAHAFIHLRVLHYEADADAEEEEAGTGGPEAEMSSLT